MCVCVCVNANITQNLNLLFIHAASSFKLLLEFKRF